MDATEKIKNSLEQAYIKYQLKVALRHLSRKDRYVTTREWLHLQKKTKIGSRSNIARREIKMQISDAYVIHLEEFHSTESTFRTYDEVRTYLYWMIVLRIRL